MNYYERYCGDYSRDTAHLSSPSTAPTRCCSTPTIDGKTVQAEYGPLYRICRAMSTAEQKCARSVVDEFFPIFDDGLRHNVRADREIVKAMKRINAARRNGANGGRPRENPMGSDSGTHQKPGGLLNGNPDGFPE